jgi:hypothetical protein
LDIADKIRDPLIEALPGMKKPVRKAEEGKAVDNINCCPKGGTGSTYALRRLKRDHPELAR